MATVNRAETEHYVAMVVLFALALLVAIHFGFRGVNFAGVSVKAS
jgi:hypothetical protein